MCQRRSGLGTPYTAAAHESCICAPLWGSRFIAVTGDPGRRCACPGLTSIAALRLEHYEGTTYRPLRFLGQ